MRKGRKFLRTTHCSKRSEETIKRYEFTNRTTVEVHLTWFYSTARFLIFFMFLDAFEFKRFELLDIDQAKLFNFS